MALDLDTFLVTVYCVIDDLSHETFAAHKPVRPGAEPEMSESEVLTVVVLTQWQQSRSEGAFLGYVRQHWRASFPRVLSQSAFNRRARDLMGVLCALGPLLSRRLDQILESTPPYEVLDTVPVPLMRRCRGDRQHLFGLEAAIGQGGSDKDWYYGVSLLGAVTPSGFLSGFVLGPANTQERWLAEALLRWRQAPTAPPPSAADLAPLVGPSHKRGGRVGPTRIKVRMTQERSFGTIRRYKTLSSQRRLLNDYGTTVGADAADVADHHGRRAGAAHGLCAAAVEDERGAVRASAGLRLAGQPARQLGEPGPSGRGGRRGHQPAGAGPALHRSGGGVPRGAAGGGGAGGGGGRPGGDPAAATLQRGGAAGLLHPCAARRAGAVVAGLRREHRSAHQRCPQDRGAL